MRKTITYQWHLAELMARAGMHNSTDLLPHLKERGIDLSPSQIYRLVTGRPEPVSLQFLATVCDIFGCGPENLLTYTSSTRTKKAASAGNVVDLDKTVRPTRARIIHP
jgi:DNA-binding Xre family transcriptional regulator